MANYINNSQNALMLEFNKPIGSRKSANNQYLNMHGSCATCAERKSNIVFYVFQCGLLSEIKSVY